MSGPQLKMRYIGRRNITDLAESKLVQNIRNGNQRAIEFHLRGNDIRYMVQSLRGILLRSIRRSAAKKLESTTLRVAFQKMKEQTFKNQNILA